ncbi:MAG: AAA family ATPase, partial [Brevinema sp.]
MITKIGFKGNYKQFKDVQTPHELKKYTLFYGMNGTGKSTLSRLFYILEEYKKNPDFNISKYNEIKNAELTYNTNPIDWGNLDNFYQNNNILVRVFNQDYIRRTINSQTTTECEAIFVLGQENKKLKDDLQCLQKEKQDLENQKQEKIESKNQLTQPSFNSSEHAKDIRTELNKLTHPTELIRPSDLRSDHLESFLNQKTCPILTDQQEDSYVQIIKNNKGYSELNAPKIEIDINSLIHDTKIILEQTVESKTIERLEQNQQLKRWVKEGYSEFSKNNNESPNLCPFCEQSITQEFWNTLSDAFTDQQAEFTKQIQTLITKISEKKKIISNIGIIDSSLIYPTINNSVKTIQNFQTATSNISSILAQLVDKLEAKKDSLDNSLDINIQYDNQNKQRITEYVSMIAYHNQEIKNRDKTFAEAKNALLLHEIASLTDTYETYISNKNSYDTKILNIDQEINTIDRNIGAKNTEITNKQQEIKRQNTNIEQINKALHKYMGHNSIKFIVAGADDNITFRLVRLDESENIINNNEPVFLSEGETTLVAFIYFINQLENRDLNNQGNQKNNYIIVIDDPITSMDIDFIYYIIGIIRDLLSKEKENK